MLKRRWGLIALLATIAACQGSTVRRRNVITLIDYSGSVSAEDMQRYGNAVAKELLGNFRERDALAVYPVDEAAAFRDNRLATIDLSRQEFSRQSDGVTHKSDSVRARLLIYLGAMSDSVLAALAQGKEQRRSFARTTDILGAIERIATRLESSPTPSKWARFLSALSGEAVVETKNVLVICSDMINESPDANFSKAPPSTGDVDRIIAALKEKGRLPQLGGVAVFVVGRTGRSTQQVDAIKNFWTRYFHETGADVRMYDFDVAGRLGPLFASL